MYFGRVESRVAALVAAVVICLAAPQLCTLASTGRAGAERPALRPGPEPGSLPPERPGAAGPRVWPRVPGSPKPRIECVAHALEPAPGIPGFWYYCIGNGGGMDAAGNVLFCAFLDGPGVHEGNGIALFYGPPGGVQLIVWESQQAPDMPDQVIIASLLECVPSISQDGEIAFTAQLSGPGITADVNDRVLYVGTPGDFHVLRQSGDPAPDCPGYYTRQPVGFFSPHGILRVTDCLLPGYNRMTVWVGPPDDLQLAYYDGMQAPACAPGVGFAGIDSVMHNDAGEIGFRGELFGPGVTSANSQPGLPVWSGNRRQHSQAALQARAARSPRAARRSI